MAARVGLRGRVRKGRLSHGGVFQISCKLIIDASVQRTIKEVNPDVIGLSVRNIDSQKMTDQGFFLQKLG